MNASPPTGEFSRATHLSIKTLRCDHRVGLLEPADIDPHTGYRRYTSAQIPAAQIIRRFRALNMPVEEIARVLAAGEIGTRNALIAAHLTRTEDEMARTRGVVESLRALLASPAAASRPEIRRRRADAAPASTSPLPPWSRTSPSTRSASKGPTCDYYLTCSRDTSDSSRRRTEIGWPIFHTGPDPGLSGTHLP